MPCIRLRVPHTHPAVTPHSGTLAECVMDQHLTHPCSTHCKARRTTGPLGRLRMDDLGHEPPVSYAGRICTCRTGPGRGPLAYSRSHGALPGVTHVQVCGQRGRPFMSAPHGVLRRVSPAVCPPSDNTCQAAQMSEIGPLETPKSSKRRCPAPLRWQAAVGLAHVLGPAETYTPQHSMCCEVSHTAEKCESRHVCMI